MWQQWVNVVLGLWVVATGFMNLQGSSYVSTMVISGLVIAGLALWGALKTGTERDSGRMVHRTQQ